MDSMLARYPPSLPRPPVPQLAVAERWHTRTVAERAQLLKLCVAYLGNAFVVPLLAAQFAGSRSSWYSRGGLMESAFYMQLASALLPPLGERRQLALPHACLRLLVVFCGEMAAACPLAHAAARSSTQRASAPSVVAATLCDVEELMYAQLISRSAKTQVRQVHTVGLAPRSAVRLQASPPTFPPLLRSPVSLPPPRP